VLGELSDQGASLVMGNAWNVHCALDAGMVTNVNQALITICDQYADSKTRSEEVNGMVQAYAGSSRYGQYAFVPAGLKVATVSEFLRARFSLDAE
jgi:hypothetical protein